MNKVGWIAWTVAVGMWAGLLIHLVESRDRPLCAPPGANVVVRLAQNQGNNREAGVVYMGYADAKSTRDRLDTWLHQYSQCP